MTDTREPQVPTLTTDAGQPGSALNLSYWQIVWRQFRRHVPAMIGLYMVLSLFLVAVFAPFLANKYPYYWRSESEGLTFPLFRSLTNLDLTILCAFALVVLLPVTKRVLRRTGWLFWQLHEIRRAIAVNLLLFVLATAAMVNFDFRTIGVPPFREFSAYHLGVLLFIAAILLTGMTRRALVRMVGSYADRRLAWTALGINLLASLLIERLLLEVGFIPLLWGLLLLMAALLAPATRRLLRWASEPDETSRATAPALVVNLMLLTVASMLLGRYGFEPIEVPVLWTISKGQFIVALVAILLALVPVTLWLLSRAELSTERRWAVAAAGHGYLIVLVVLLLTNARVVPERIFQEREVAIGGTTHTVRLERNYREEIANGAEAGYLFPPIRYSPSDILVGSKFEVPSRKHVLGADRLGRSTAARLIYGTRVSLAVGFISVGLSVLIGVLVGGVSAYFGGWVDLILQRIVEIFMCFPALFLILTVVALFGSKLWLIMAVIGLTRWTGTARFIRAEILKVRTLDYVTAARALGLRSVYIVIRHALPNSIAPVLVGISFGVAAAIGLEVSLSFLGLGDPDYPSWGLMLKQARAIAEQHPSMLIIPGVTIFFAVLAYNLVGEGMRDAIDPRLKM